MLGALDRAQKNVVVVGAGFAGLVAAYELDRRGYRVELFEEAPRAGGLLGTVRTPLGLVEQAAHSFLLNAPLAELCRELGVALVPVRQKSRARYIARDGKLRRFPLSAPEAFRLAARASFARARCSEQGMNLADWGRQHLGAGATENLLTPFLQGIYAAPPERLSVSAVFPRLEVPVGRTLLQAWFGRGRRQKQKCSRSARKRMHAPREGMQALIEALERRLEERLGARFRRGVAVHELPWTDRRSHATQGAPPALDLASNVVLAVPAYRAAELLRDEAPALATSLAAVEYAPLVSATVFARATQFARVPRGVGVLVAPGEKSRLLGILFNSSAFEGRVGVDGTMISMTAMLGGAGDPGAIALPDAAITDAITSELARLFGFSGAVERIEIHRWPRAIPTYSVELESTWAVARATWCACPGRVLFGNYTGQVSLRGMAESAALSFGF